ncbi:MAG: hypothetical protein JO271_18725 [Verrucomicrobia bacterium]|nr:hypothetical protein [Verrucomicrobiota bacterium]
MSITANNAIRLYAINRSFLTLFDTRDSERLSRLLVRTTKAWHPGSGDLRTQEPLNGQLDHHCNRYAQLERTGSRERETKENKCLTRLSMMHNKIVELNSPY